MKRLPFIFTIVAVAALAASLAYWTLQLLKPAQRPIAPMQVAAAPEPSMEAAKGLFGGQVTVAAVSNYQLRGVVAAGLGRDSAAIIAVDGQPALALAVGREVAPGVTIKEIHPKHVLLSEGGVIKRVDLASDAGAPGVGGPPGAVNLPPPVQQQSSALLQPPAVPVMTPGMTMGAPNPSNQQPPRMGAANGVVTSPPQQGPDRQ
jgi:general secretion pathway protein C